MFWACERALILVWLAGIGACLAQEAPVSGPECSAGVCVVNVTATRLISSPCVGDSVLVAYSQSNGATLIQCSQDATDAEGNKSFIYDRRDPGAKAFEFWGGRFIRTDFLAVAESSGIPDRFGAVRLCPLKSRAPAVNGGLLLAEKQPENSQENPYCYHIHYIVAGKNGLRVQSDDGHEAPPLSDKAAAEWATLRKNLAPYIDAEAQSTLPERKKALVASDKARLFTSPSTSAESKMYLVKGDEVEIVDDSKISEGWCLVRYVTNTGRVIERWTQTHDLNLGAR